MTTTPTNDEVVGIPLKYGIIWEVKKGNAITSNGTVMERDGNRIPIIPDENLFDIAASRDATGEPEEPEEEEVIPLSWFHTTYKWDSVELKYSSINEEGIRALKDFEISAKVYSVKQKLQGPDSGQNGEEEEYEFNRLEGYRVNSINIVSSDPNNSGTWVFPDDYPDQPDPNHPKQYGGVITFAEDVPAEMKAGQYFTCGIEDGPDKNGVVPWVSTNGRQQEAASEYIYLEVFDQANFAFTPRNSFDSLPQSATNEFKSTPYYPDVKDPNGLAAPIYPMNALTAFVPDPRESVTVTYKVSIDISVEVNGRYVRQVIENSEITIKQTCIQDTSDYISQMEMIGKYCQFQNPDEFTQEELSPNYNYDYPYTLVSGYDGLEAGVTPTTRGDDKNNEPLQRGDVWYDPETDTRLTWNVSDVPEAIEIIDGGKGYKDDDDALCIWMVPVDKDGNQVRCFKLEDVDQIPSDLFANIKTEKGKIISAEISDTGSPTAWKDGDMIRIIGGNNQAIGRISIKDPAGWSPKFINKY